MFLTVAQIFKPGGFTGAAGTPNFLLDLNPYVTEVQWTNSQIGDMQSATLRCRLAYEQDLDIIAGNWVIFACMGGQTQSAYAATATQIAVENATDDLGHQHFALGDPIVISDGTNSEVFTIGAISWSGSTATITLAAAQSQNSTALLNGYAGGTTVARLRWQGMITARKRTTDLSNIFSIIVQGMMWRYTKVIGDFAIKAQDSATSMLKIAQAYTTQVPEIIVSAANFAPANNIMYTGSSKHTSIAKLIGDILKTESGGAVPTQPNEASYWSFWVDELRQAHHAQIPTINSSSPTYSVDLLNGNSYGDVLGPVQPQDMDMARMLNCAVVEGGKDNNGKVVDIIVTHKPSYTQWGYYEGFLSNPNISGGTTSEVASALATWAAGQIGVLAWPQQSGRFQFIVASMRLTCRDLLEITGFTDSSTLVTNPTQIQYTASMAKMIVTGAVNITQQQPDEAALIREIAGMQSLRTSDRGSSTSIQSSETAGAYVISGLDVAVSGLNWTTTAGQVFFEGATYDIPAANGSVAANDQIRLGVQVSGTPPAGYAVPCVCPMPNFVANTRLSAGQWFELTNPPAATTAPSVTVDGTAGTTEYQYQIVASNAGGDSAASPATTVTTGNATLSTANYNALSWTAATDASEYKVLRQVGGTGGFELLAVTSATTLSDQGQYTPSAYTPAGSPNYAGMVQQTSFAGVYLATLSTFNGSSIDVVQQTTPWGGVGNWNLKAITGGTLSVSASPSVTVTAEGSASARVQISCAVLGVTYDDTIASFDVVRSFAGENLWGLPFIAIHAPANGTVAFTDHGLAAGQGYDYGIIARGRNGEPLNAAPVLIGTSPTVSAAAVTAALTNANLPSMPAGATITVSAVSETVYESGMHTLITGGPIGLAPVVEVDFTLGDANTPPATQWGAGFVGYIRQTGTTAYARVPQGHIDAASLTNNSAQSVRFHLTPGESYDGAVALADGQGNETPAVVLFTNYSVAKMGRGDPIGPILGRGHFLGDTTGNITTAISDGTNLEHDIMSGGVQTALNASGQSLLVEFPGGVIGTDGALTNVDGVTSTQSYPLPAGTTIEVSAQIAKGVATDSNGSQLVVGNGTNGYEIVNDGSGSIYLRRTVGGTGTVLGAIVNRANDTNYHTLRLTLTVVSSTEVQIQGTWDGVDPNAGVYVTDSSLNLTSGTWPITLYTGGSAGKVLHLNVSTALHHFLAAPRQILNTISSDPTKTGLDGVIEGVTYQRTLATALTSGQVDLAKAGVVNKVASNITYTGGATVDSLKPEEVGANVTETRTSNDTAHVNAVASSSISPIATLMPAEAGADVTATWANQSAAVKANMDSSGNSLLVEFPGGYIGPDGALTNVDGVSSTQAYPLPAGTKIEITAQIAKGVSTGYSGIILGNRTNGYAVAESYFAAGRVELVKWVAGAVSQVASFATETQDTNYHTLHITISVLGASSNEIQMSWDGVDPNAGEPITDTSLDLTTGLWPITLLTGGSAGKVLHLNVSTALHHYLAQTPEYLANFTSGGLAKSTTMFNGLAVAINNTSGNPGYSYTSKTTSIDFTIPATTYTRSDGSTVSVAQATPSFSGLTASRGYFFDLWYDVGSNTFGAAKYTSAPSAATVLADCYSQGRIVVAAKVYIVTPLSGTGSGSGSPGAGGCPATYQEILTHEHGLIRADELAVGMHVSHGDGWVRVVALERRAAPLWRYTVREPDGIKSYDVNDTHASFGADREWVLVTDMRPGSSLYGGIEVIDSRYIGDGDYIALEVEGHVYSLGKALVHNISL